MCVRACVRACGKFTYDFLFTQGQGPKEAGEQSTSKEGSQKLGGMRSKKGSMLIGGDDLSTKIYQTMEKHKDVSMKTVIWWTR